MNLKTKISKQIINWNNRFPLDYWWRKKYNIPYGSKEHREMDFLKMYYDYLEEKMIQKNLKNDDEVDVANLETKENEDGTFSFDKKEASGKEVKMTKSEIDTAFENLDLSEFDN